jgi:predicted kinase
LPKLIVNCGTSFAGKSTLARCLADHFGYPEVDVDETKAEIFGASVDDDALCRADWERIYHETDRRIARHLAEGRSVIDASRNFCKAERRTAQAICQHRGAQLVTVHVDTPESVTRQRVLANRQSPTRRDVSDDNFAVILASWELPTADEGALVFFFTDEATEWVAQNTSVLSVG